MQNPGMKTSIPLQSGVTHLSQHTPTSPNTHLTKHILHQHTPHLTFFKTFIAQILPESAPVLFLTKKTYKNKKDHMKLITLYWETTHLSISTLPQDLEQVKTVGAYLLWGSVHWLWSEGEGLHVLTKEERGRGGGRRGVGGRWGEVRKVIKPPRVGVKMCIKC